jgi:hypothetical protein
MQRRAVILYRRFEATDQSNLSSVKKSFGTDWLSRNVGTKITILRCVISQVLDFLTLEDGADRLSRNVGTELLLNAA